MKALVILSHPRIGSFNHALAELVRATWTASGCHVRLHDLHAERFDPILSAEESIGVASQDPVVRAHIESLRESDILGVVHPNCWGSPPAMMKGWIDRVFAPEAAYTIPKGEKGAPGIGLLKTKAALVLNTGNTPLDRELEHFGDPLDRIWRRCILDYCGVTRVERRLFGVVATSTAEQRASWLNEAKAMAEAAFRHAAASNP
jgi:NAD(P)H dehydrogenase (quinone)